MHVCMWDYNAYNTVTQQYACVFEAAIIATECDVPSTLLYLFGCKNMSSSTVLNVVHNELMQSNSCQEQ